MELRIQAGVRGYEKKNDITGQESRSESRSRYLFYYVLHKSGKFFAGKKMAKRERFGDCFSVIFAEKH